MATPGPCGSYTGESDHPLPTKEKSKVTLFEKRRRACKHDRPTSQVLDIDLRTKATCLRNKGKQKGIVKRVDPKDAGFNNKRSVQFDGSRNFDFSARLMELEAEKQKRESKMSEMESQIKKLVEHVFKQPVRATGTHLMQNSNQFPPPYPPQSLFQPQVWYNAPDPKPDPVAVPIPALTRISAATPNPIPILIPSSNSAFVPAPIKPIPVSNSAFAPPSVKPIPISNSAFVPPPVNPIPISIPTSTSAFVPLPPSVAAPTSIRDSGAMRL